MIQAANSLITFKVLYHQSLCSRCALGAADLPCRKGFVCTLYRPKLRNVNTESIRKPFSLCFLVTQLWDRKQLQGNLDFITKHFLSMWHAFCLIPRSGSPSLSSFPGQGLPLFPHSQVRVSPPLFFF